MSDPASPQNQWGNWQLQFGIPVKQARYEVYKIGQIIKLLKFPCQPTPMVYLETLGPALLNAITSVVEPDLKELYKWGHGKSPGRKHGRSLLKDIKSPVAASDLLGPIFEDGAGKYLFEFADMADKASFWVWFASIVTDGVFEWVSMAHKKAGCTGKPDFYRQSNMPLGPVGGVSPGQVSGTTWINAPGQEPTYFAGEMTVPPGATWSAGGALIVKPWIAQPPQNYRIVVLNKTTGETLSNGSFQNADSTNGKATLAFGGSQPAANFPQDIVVGMEIDNDSAWEYAPQSGYVNLSWTYL